MICVARLMRWLQRFNLSSTFLNKRSYWNTATRAWLMCGRLEWPTAKCSMFPWKHLNFRCFLCSKTPWENFRKGAHLVSLFSSLLIHSWCYKRRDEKCKADHWSGESAWLYGQERIGDGREAQGRNWKGGRVRGEANRPLNLQGRKSLLEVHFIYIYL